jgi:hypothetical protein
MVASIASFRIGLMFGYLPLAAIGAVSPCPYSILVILWWAGRKMGLGGARRGTRRGAWGGAGRMGRVREKERVGQMRSAGRVGLDEAGGTSTRDGTHGVGRMGARLSGGDFAVLELDYFVG